MSILIECYTIYKLCLLDVVTKTGALTEMEKH